MHARFNGLTLLAYLNYTPRLRYTHEDQDRGYARSAKLTWKLRKPSAAGEASGSAELTWLGTTARWLPGARWVGTGVRLLARACYIDMSKSEGLDAGMVFAVSFYMFSSAGMIIFNKLVLREVHLPIALCVVQMLFTCAVLCVVPSLRATIHFGSKRDALRWARVIPPLFAIMLASSMVSLKHATMGAVVVVRNIAPLPSLAIEALSGERLQVDVQSVLALLSAVASVILYSRNDIAFSMYGLMWMLGNMVAAVIERVLQRRMIAVEPIDVSKSGMMMLNNGIGAVLLLLLLAPFGELEKLPELLALTPRQNALLLLSCVGGMSISYAGLHCQKYVTATAMLVLNNSCKFSVIAFGMVYFQEAKSVAAIVGCFAAIGSGLWYARARSQLAAVADEPPEERPRHVYRSLIQAVFVASLLMYSLQPAPAPPPPKASGPSAVTPAKMQTPSTLAGTAAVVNAGGGGNSSHHAKGGSGKMGASVLAGKAPISTANRTGEHSHSHGGHIHGNHTGSGGAHSASHPVVGPSRRLLTGIRLAVAHSETAKAGNPRRREDANAAELASPHHRAKSERHPARSKDAELKGGLARRPSTHIS